MRIAYIVTEYVTEANFSGGLANYTYRIAQSLLKQGHDPEVFVISNVDRRLVHDGVLVHQIKIQIPLWLSIFNRFQQIFLLGLLSRIPTILSRIICLKKCFDKRDQDLPFDIAQYTHLLGTGLLRSKVPSVVRLSSYSDLWIPYGFQFTSPFERFVENLAIKRADAVFCPSQYVADYAEQKLKIQIQVIESPFVPIKEINEDNSIIDGLKRKKKFPDRYGLYFGSLAEWKGIFVLVDALSELLFHSPKLGFVFIGRDLSVKDNLPASEYIKERLLPFKERIFVSPPLEHPQLYPFIRKSAFVTLPSLADNLPNTCIESMWMKKVVIGTRGRSFDQLITHRENGFLCTPGNAESLATCIKNVLSLSSSECELIGNRAYERIQLLSPDLIGNETIDFYNRILRGTQKGSFL